MATDPSERVRVRSPGYPSIDLEEAVAKAQQVYQHERRNAVSPEILSEHWGYAEKSSGGRLTLAALKKFGLLEEVGGGNSRQLRLTKLAQTIILSAGPEHQTERLVALREAALSPKIHKELWEMWHAELPSDGAMRLYLIREREFNDSSVGDFIKQYKRTLAFARLNGDEALAWRSGGGTIEGGDDDPDDPPPRRAEAPMTAAPAPQSPPAQVGSPFPFPGQTAPNVVDMNYPLLGDDFAFLRVTKPMSQESFDLLQEYIGLLARTLGLKTKGDATK